MGCRHEWAEGDQLAMNLYLEFPWTWADFDESAKEVYGKLRDLNRHCGVVVNVSKMGAIPKGNVLAHLQYVERLIPDTVFISVLVGAPYAATVFMNMFTKLRPKAKRITVFSNSMEEAHALIRERYQALQDKTLTAKPR